MSLVFAALVPHAPILIPEIGGSDLKSAEKTVQGLVQLGMDFAESRPDTVICISPHAPVLHDRVGVSYADELSGNLQEWQFDYQLDFKGDKRLVEQMVEAAWAHKVAVDTYAHQAEQVTLDYATVVPLYYLTKGYYPERLTVVSISDFSLLKHWNFGEALAHVCGQTDKRVALIASGDLSHRLTAAAPYGFDPAGPRFDEFVHTALQNKNVEALLNIDPELWYKAGECGYRALIMLLGAISKQPLHPQIYSYEGPFGVGHMVMRLA